MEASQAVMCSGKSRCKDHCLRKVRDRGRAWTCRCKSGKLGGQRIRRAFCKALTRLFPITTNSTKAFDPAVTVRVFCKANTGSASISDEGPHLGSSQATSLFPCQGICTLHKTHTNTRVCVRESRIQAFLSSPVFAANLFPPTPRQSFGRAPTLVISLFLWLSV